jgi:hypothetical protein
MKYCNVTPSHHEIIQKCTAEYLWINHGGIIYSPWDYIRKFGVSHVVHQQNTTTVDPVELIEQAILVIRKKISEGSSEVKIQSLIERTEYFALQVKDYYLNDQDGRLLNSIRTGIWQE